MLATRSNMAGTWPHMEVADLSQPLPPGPLAMSGLSGSLNLETP
jgi:hypothetical protein